MKSPVHFADLRAGPNQNLMGKLKALLDAVGLAEKFNKEHLLQTIEKTATLIGQANTASQHVHDHVQISLQEHLEILLVLGLSEEQTKNVTDLGYTEKDRDELLTWLLHYNDCLHHVSTGFTPEQMEWFYSVGLIDDQIFDLQTVLENHYAQRYTAQQMVKQHQTELLYIQISLSITALQELSKLDKGKDKNKGNNLEKTLLNAEERLLEAIGTVSEDQSSLEQVKALSKQVYKAAEQKICKGEDQYIVDFFVGLQVHCGAVTALHGDVEIGLAEIERYKGVVLECAASPERPAPYSMLSGGQPMSLGDTISIPMTDIVGQVEEFDETNNVGVAHLFVKASDTTLWESQSLLVGFIATYFSQAEFSLHSVVEFLTAGISITTIGIGTGGALFVLVVTAPSVGHEWPPAVPGWIEGDEVIIIVEGSYGQGHITERAESGKDPCIRSSHQAILDDKYMIQDIIMHAHELLYNPSSGQYVFYFKQFLGDKLVEWAVFVEEYENDYYQLITAYKADCKPFMCGGKKYKTILEKWIECEEFELVSFW